MARVKVMVPLAAGLALAGCVTPFEARVARFQQLQAPPSGTFVIEPRDKENVGGLEFGTYANLVRQQLVSHGFREAPSASAADYVVQLDYHVTQPREKVRTRPGIGWGGAWGPWGGWGPAGFGWGPYWGGWGGWGWGGFGPGFGGWGNDVYSVTQYNAIVAMRMNRASDKQSVFEGHAETVSSSNNLTQLVPNLVTAMFTRFPGTSGETVRVRFDPRKPEVPPTVKPMR